ncbi:neurocalcin-delta B-like [Branchiostoma floridae]|uniref:Neurocalcin-delta B-like n=1 Tax=Branchiostoma floridae TaxID=7739 RepID=A0A9J7LLL9_BRAFL|nr:neurocalcin-delta B-like [Branchiostoma floridae]
MSEHHFLHFFTDTFKMSEQEDKNTLARQIFRTFDKDGSGSVDFREFIIGLSTLLRGTTVERLKWVFNMYDLDSNGSVTKDELIHVLKMMHKLRYPEMAVENVDALDEHLQSVADKIFTGIFYILHRAEVDVDGDGTLKLKEFVEGVRRNPGLLRPTRN